MRISSIIGLGIMLIVFLLYFYYLDPLFAENRLIAFIIFMTLFMFTMYFERFLRSFERFNKRIDKSLSIYIVIGTFIFILVLGLFIG